MLPLNKDFKEFIALLNAHRVKYIIVGGYAVGFYGHPRFTGDIDFWIAYDVENATKVISVLKHFGFESLNLKAEDLSTDDVVIQLGYEPTRIDLLTSVTGLNFEDCYKKSIRSVVEDIEINFIDLESLIRNKLATGRKQDIADADNLN